MDKIIDFNCSYDNSVGLNKEIAKNTGLQFPEAYKAWETMTQLALALKEHEGANFCQLPFCHTVEGEALGGSINYGDENLGPRGKDYVCSRIEDLLALPKIDYTKGRIAEVLKACRALRHQGENVALYVSGPFTILNVLIDPRYVFKGFKKKPEVIREIFNRLQDEILAFVEEAQKAGVNLISYGDSSGGLNILGPKLSEEVVETFTYPLLKRVEEILNKETIVLLCPKTTFALLGTEKAQWKELQLPAPMKYTEACVEVIGQAQFVGQMCIKNKKYELKNATIKTVELL